MTTIQANIFAILDDEETDDVQQLIQHAKAKASSPPSTTKKAKKGNEKDKKVNQHAKTKASSRPTMAEKAKKENEKDKKVQPSNNANGRGQNRSTHSNNDNYKDYRHKGYNGNYQQNYGAYREGGTQVPKETETEEEKAEGEEKMTLEQYEKVVVEKRKVLKAKKLEERKVTLDKELESMKLVCKNKQHDVDDMLMIKLNSNSKKDRLKRGKSDKEEKGRKAKMSINEFFKSAEEGGERQGQQVRQVEEERPTPQFNTQITMRKSWSSLLQNISGAANGGEGVGKLQVLPK